MKKTELQKIINIQYSVNEQYCKDLIAEYNKESDVLDLSKSTLYCEVSNCKSQDEAIIKYVEVFAWYYLNLSLFINKENYKACALLRDALVIDKKITKDNIKEIDDEFLKAVEYAEQTLKNMYLEKKIALT